MDRANPLTRPASSGTRFGLARGMVVLATMALASPSPAIADTITVFLDLLGQLAGANASDARELAHATVAATRSLDAVPEDEQPVALGGAIGSAAQTVGRDRPLRLTWYGGRPPFRVELAATAAGGWATTLVTDTRLTAIDLGDAPAGAYRLQIEAANARRLSLRVNLVDPADIPRAPQPEAAAAATAEQKELLQAVWLLMRGGMKWHLDALSRLQTMAEVQHDQTAQLVLTPEP